MSGNQKFIISVLGAVVGHLLLFLLLIVLFTVANLMAPTRSDAVGAAPEPEPPQEMTIMLADLMEQIAVEPVPEPVEQQYMRTELDQASEVAPKNAPFHSDLNTLANSDRPPDPNQSDRNPAVTGRDDLPFIEIRDREYVDGEFLDRSASSLPSPAAQASSAQEALPTPDQADPRDPAAKPTPIRDPSETPAETELKSLADPAELPREAPDATPLTPADADTPPDTAADTEIQPDALMITDSPTMPQREESYDTPFATDRVTPVSDLAKEDREATAVKRSEQNGEAAAPETPEAASAMPVAKPLLPTMRETVEAAAPPATQSPANDPAPELPPTPKPPSDETAFMPHTRARQLEGSAANVGNTPSFDVEASAMGRYKKEVTQAVERQWHRYREQNADFVTYGTLKVKFRVDKKGTPRNLKLIKNDANSVMAEFTLRAVLDADIPEMPEEVSSMLGSSGLEISYDVIVY